MRAVVLSIWGAVFVGLGLLAMGLDFKLDMVGGGALAARRGGQAGAVASVGHTPHRSARLIFPASFPASTRQREAQPSCVRPGLGLTRPC